MSLYGIPYLKQKLLMKSARGTLRYIFYDAKNLAFDFGISTPPDLKNYMAVCGWCAKAVDSLADRIDFYEFRDDNFNLNGIYDLNNKGVLTHDAFVSALINSCSFIYITQDADGFPRLQVIDGTNATGIIDTTNYLLTEGYAVLERDQIGVPTKEAYFTADYTAYYEGGVLVEQRNNPAAYPLLVPIIFRPDARRPFGHSRISRACMSYVGSALRTIKRSEISAEFYSFPQKYATGIDESAEANFDKWAAAMSAMMQFTTNADGEDHVHVGQFTQASMTPHYEQLKMFAALFAGETGLTLDDLGFATANPSSAEAIKATHENLRLTAKAAAASMGTGLLNAGYLAASVRDRVAYNRYLLYNTKPVFYPAFPADASTLGAVGDGLGKIAQSIPDYITEERVFDLLGV